MDDLVDLKRRLQSELQRSDFTAANRTAEALTVVSPATPLGWVGIAASAEALFPPDVALNRIRQAYGNAPESGVVIQKYIALLLRFGDVRAADDVVLDVVANGDKGGLADDLRARIAQRRDVWSTSETHWQAILGRQPDLADALRQVSLCRENRGDVKGALACLNRLDTLDKLGPWDKIRTVRLRATEDGRLLDRDESSVLLRSLKDFPGAAMLHFGVLVRDGDIGGALSFAEAFVERHPNAHAVRRSLAQLQFSLGYFQETADLYAADVGFLKQDAKCLIGYVDCLARLERFREAHDFLDSLDAVTWTGSLSARYRLYTAEEDFRAALRTAIARFRFCPDTEAHEQLTLALLNRGSFASAHRALAAMESSFQANLHAWGVLAALSTSVGQAQRARHWYERLYAYTQPPNQAVGFSDVLWQFGEGAQAWCAMLAAATGDIRLASLDLAIRRDALRQIASDIRQRKERLDRLAGGARAQEAADLSRVLRSAYVTKTYLRPDPEVDRALAEFSALEAAGDVQAAVDGLKNSLSLILASTASQNKPFLLLTRLARLEASLGDTAGALAHLELAARIKPATRIGFLNVKRMMQQRGPWLKLGQAADAASRVPILILTWAGRFDESQHLARHIHANLGRTVMTVVGIPDLERVRAVPQDFGYDLQVPSDDGYSALPKKLTLAFRHLYVCSHCTGVLKVDDDIAVTDFTRFEAMIRQFHDRKSDYAGRLVMQHSPVYHFGRHRGRFEDIEVSHHPMGLYCGGGQGYFLSRRALSVIFEKSLTESPPDAPGVIYEDVYFGTLLKAGGIKAENYATLVHGGYEADCFEPLALPETIDEVLSQSSG